MKIKTIEHVFSSYSRERKGDLIYQKKNTDQKLHSFPIEREYKRALNAVKLERLFAKPFVCSFDGHRDTITSLRRNPTNISFIASASLNGELYVWDLITRKWIFRKNDAHDMVKGICFEPEFERILSCGRDQNIKVWDYKKDKQLKTYETGESFSAIDHHQKKKRFVTAGETISLWSYERDEPLFKQRWNIESFLSIRFNQTEQNLLLATAKNREIFLLDLRTKNIVSKTCLPERAESPSWNPMKPMFFCVASNDCNSYVFDIRKMNKNLHPLFGHTNAVLGCEYSPTGEEIVTGSYDKTIRIFNEKDVQSREVYYTPRMQRVFSVCFSGDSKYVFSASEDTNIRMWKTVASETMSVKSTREERSLEYKEALKKKFSHFPEIQRISKHRQLPRNLRGQIRAKKEKYIADGRKQFKKEERLKKEKELEEEMYEIANE